MNLNLNLRYTVKIYGWIILTVGLSMLPAAFTSYHYGEEEMVVGFIISSLTASVAGIAFIVFSRPRKTLLRIRDGYFITATVLMIVSLLGMFPYLISGYTDSLCAALFESVAGFTTTGATVLDTATASKGFIMWKAISGWLGGLGILVFMVALFSMLSGNNHRLSISDIGYAGKNNTVKKLLYSVRIIYLIYIGFTVLEFFLLSLSGADIFDVIVTTLRNVSTSGFFARSSSAAAMDSTYQMTVITLFSLLSSISFPLYALALRGHFKAVANNSELKAFLMIIILSSSFIAINLHMNGTYSTAGESIKNAFIQSVAFSSTSGYTSFDINSWPQFSLLMLCILMLIGGCSSSTAGSLKVVRVIVMFRIIKQTLFKRIHPHAVTAIEINRHNISIRSASGITTFIFSFFILIFTGSIIVSLQGYDHFTSFSAAISMLSNTGVYIGGQGYMGYYGCFSAPIQLVMTMLMIIGRLEMFSVFAMCNSLIDGPGSKR